MIASRSIESGVRCKNISDLKTNQITGGREERVLPVTQRYRLQRSSVLEERLVTGRNVSQRKPLIYARQPTIADRRVDLEGSPRVPSLGEKEQHGM